MVKMRTTPEGIRALVAKMGLDGEWSVGGNGEHKFKAVDGGVLNWYPTTGTVNFQGPKKAKERLRNLFDIARGETDGLDEGQTAVPSRDPKTRIFVVHGHDQEARDQLELVLRRLDLDPFVLVNTAGGGMTIIESLEKQIGKEAEAEFGIVLMTPDDVGYSKEEGETDAQPRARQNVILEMGMLLSSLTRERVAILVKGHVEVPSDAQGIIYLRFNEHVKEVVPKLCERLQTCGIDLKPEQIARASA